MSGENKKRIAAIADLHIGESDKGKWVDFFTEVSKNADVLAICGDLTDTGDESEAHILVGELKACSIPVVGVLGNHDHEKSRHKLIRQVMQNHPNVHILDGEATVVAGIGFAGVKGFGGGFDNHMLSMFGEGAMKSFVQEAVEEALHLDRALARLDQEHKDIKKVALLHYSPIKETVQGEPEQIFPFLGSSRLAEPLSRRNVEVVFHGHAHIGVLEGSIGGKVKVFNVARHVLQKSGYGKPYFLYEI
jgi:Icc-related predicted phosphoesterase